MMKRFNIKNIALAAFIFITPFVMMSCLSGTNQISSQLQVGFEFTSLDDTVTAGTDSVMFDNIRFILGESFFLGTGGTDSLIINRDPRQVDFDQNSPNPILLAAGTFPEGTYQGLTLTLPKAPAEDEQQVFDDDFVDGNTRFTLIAEGTYNGEPFTFRSERVFNPSFPVSATVDEFNQGFTFIIMNDVAGWFLSGNSLLDPREEDNSSEINDNIEGLFNIEVPE